MPPTTANATVFESIPKSRVEEVTDFPLRGLRYTASALRYVLGVIFLWAFVDKMWGLGFATPAGKGWINGYSPTVGFLSHASGTFGPTFQAIAGNLAVDYLFMLGLLGIGLALITGIGQRVAGWSGAILMLLMYAAATVGVKATSNPIVDDHIVYMVLFLALAFYPQAGDTLGMGRFWRNLPYVRDHKWIQ